MRFDAVNITSHCKNIMPKYEYVFCRLVPSLAYLRGGQESSCLNVRGRDPEFGVNLIWNANVWDGAWRNVVLQVQSHAYTLTTSAYVYVLRESRHVELYVAAIAFRLAMTLTFDLQLKICVKRSVFNPSPNYPPSSNGRWAQVCWHSTASFRVGAAMWKWTKSGRLELQTMCHRHYRSIFNRGDIIGLQSYRIRWKKCKIRAITPFKVIQGHRGRYQSKARMRLPIIAININWHPISYRFGVITAYCLHFGHFAFLSPLGAMGTTYDVHLELIGKLKENTSLSVNWTFFAICCRWGATGENRLKIGEFAPTRSVWLKISGSPHQSFLHG